MNVRTASLAAGLAVIAGLAPAVPAAAAAPSDGCPSGYDRLSVTELSSLGYGVPGRLDDPDSGLLSFGLPGNDNGWVCAVAMGNQSAGNGHQLYNFMDDSLRVP